MDILEYLSRARYTRFFSVSIIMILVMVGMVPILGMFSMMDEAEAKEETTTETFSSVRSGYYDIAEYGYEYKILGSKSQDYLGHSMVTMDWNGDGVFDTGYFVIALEDGGYEMGLREDAAAVPEPDGWALYVLLMLGAWAVMPPVRRIH